MSDYQVDDFSENLQSNPTEDPISFDALILPGLGQFLLTFNFTLMSIALSKMLVNMFIKTEY